MKRVSEANAIEQRGFDGDRHAKRKSGGKRQLLLVDGQSYAELGLEPGQLKENVIVEGLALEALPAGQRLKLGAETVIELTGPCVPCWKLDKIRDGLLSASWGKRGQLAKILQGGVIREGDQVTLLDMNPLAEKPINPKLP